MNIKNKNIELEILKLYKPIAEDTNLSLSSKLICSYIYNLKSFDLCCKLSNTEIAKNLNIESSLVISSIMELQHSGYINDLRDDLELEFIKVLKFDICKSNYFKFYASIINSDLKISTKFLLVYLLSFHPNEISLYALNDKTISELDNPMGSIGEAISQLKDMKLIEDKRCDQKKGGIVFSLFPNFDKRLEELLDKDLPSVDEFFGMFKYHTNQLRKYVDMPINEAETIVEYYRIIEHHQNAVERCNRVNLGRTILDRDLSYHNGCLVSYNYRYTFDLSEPTRRITGEIMAISEKEAVLKLELLYLNQIKGWLDIVIYSPYPFE